MKPVKLVVRSGCINASRYKVRVNYFTLHMNTGTRKRLNIHSIKSGSELQLNLCLSGTPQLIKNCLKRPTFPAKKVGLRMADNLFIITCP